MHPTHIEGACFSGSRYWTLDLPQLWRERCCHACGKVEVEVHFESHLVCTYVAEENGKRLLRLREHTTHTRLQQQVCCAVICGELAAVNGLEVSQPGSCQLLLSSCSLTGTHVTIRWSWLHPAHKWPRCQVYHGKRVRLLSVQV